MGKEQKILGKCALSNSLLNATTKLIYMNNNKKSYLDRRIHLGENSTLQFYVKECHGKEKNGF